MKTRSFIVIILSALLLFALWQDEADARGGSFGGSRGGFGGGRSFGRSFGGSRPKTYSTPRPSTPSAPRTSFGKQSTPSVPSSPSIQRRTSFGGTRLNSSMEYTNKYGAPRRVIPAGSTPGIPSNYVVHDYGGFGSGLMMGYMMGHTSMMWSMPFHPAFYYSRPMYVENPDGTVSVYPPTFSFAKLIFTLIIFIAIVYIIYVIVRNRRRRGGSYSQSSFS